MPETSTEAENELYTISNLIYSNKKIKRNVTHLYYYEMWTEDLVRPSIAHLVFY